MYTLIFPPPHSAPCPRLAHPVEHTRWIPGWARLPLNALVSHSQDTCPRPQGSHRAQAQEESGVRTARCIPVLVPLPGLGTFDLNRRALREDAGGDMSRIYWVWGRAGVWRLTCCSPRLLPLPLRLLSTPPLPPRRLQVQRRNQLGQQSRQRSVVLPSHCGRDERCVRLRFLGSFPPRRGGLQSEGSLPLRFYTSKWCMWRAARGWPLHLFGDIACYGAYRGRKLIHPVCADLSDLGPQGLTVSCFPPG